MKTVYKSDIVTRSSIIWCRSNFSAWDEKWKSLNQAVSNEAICNWNVRPCLQTRWKIVAQSLWCKSHFLAAIQLFKVFVLIKRGSPIHAMCGRGPHWLSSVHVWPIWDMVCVYMKVTCCFNWRLSFSGAFALPWFRRSWHLFLHHFRQTLNKISIKNYVRKFHCAEGWAIKFAWLDSKITRA